MGNDQFKCSVVVQQGQSKYAYGKVYAADADFITCTLLIPRRTPRQVAGNIPETVLHIDMMASHS